MFGFLRIAEVPPSEYEALFIKKLRQCCVVFDFMDAVSDIKAKEVKRNTLTELLDSLNKNRLVIPEALYPEIIRMVSALSLSIWSFRLLPRLFYSLVKFSKSLTRLRVIYFERYHRARILISIQKKMIRLWKHHGLIFSWSMSSF